MKDPERFICFKGYSRDKYSKVLSEFKGKYTQWVRFDDKEYVNLNNPVILPCQLLEPFEHQLTSDSRRRRDIQLLSERHIEESQLEKERIENEERAVRKLREKYK